MPDENTAVAEPKTNGKVEEKSLVIVRGANEALELKGTGWLFIWKLLKKRQKTDPDRYAFQPVKPVEKGEYDYKRWLEFLEEKQVVETSYQRVKGMSALWTDAEIDAKSGVLNEAAFIEDVQKFSSRGETFKALLDEQAELTQDIITLTKSKKENKVTAVEYAEKVAEISDRLNEIAEAIERKKEQNKSPETEEANA